MFAWKLTKLKIDSIVLMLPNWAQTLTPREILFGEAMVWESEGDLGRNEVLKVRGEDGRVNLAMVAIFLLNWIEWFLLVCYYESSFHHMISITNILSVWILYWLPGLHVVD